MYEQTDFGTTYRIKCPAGCYRADQALTERADAGDTSTPVGIYGTAYYADISKLCGAAAHMGLLNNLGGLFYVRVEKGWGPNAEKTSIGYDQALISSLRNALRSDSLDAWDRTFTVHPYSVRTMEVYTMAGKPTAPLDDACGYKDGQPPQEAQVRVPRGT